MDINLPGQERAAADPEDSAPWDVRVLRLVEAGVDVASIAENLRRTPAERLRRMQQMLGFLEAALGREVRVLDLDALERSKRAAGRAKDLLDLAELAEIKRQSKD